MRGLIVAGFVVMAAALAWLALNQQRMSRDLRLLLAENRILSEALRQSMSLAQAPPATPPPLQPVPNSVVPGKPSATLAIPEPRMDRPTGLTPPNTFQSGWVATTAPGQLSSHSSDGKLLTRYWGPEQLVGPPNSMQAGDQTTAWAQYTSQGGEGEWLHVTFEKAVAIAEVIVRETYNPGAISKVVAVLPNGQESIIWEGTEPKVEAPVDMSFPATQKVEAKAVKVYLDRRRVPGWNEIDAVELVGRDGSRQWAASATVSSAYSISAGTTGRNLQGGGLELESFGEKLIEGDVILRR